MGWLYFAIMGLLAILLGAFGSVFNTYSGLYLAKDNDLLLSMPIPVRTIMAARLLGVYLMGLMYSGVVMLPAIIVYWVTAPPLTASIVIGCPALSAADLRLFVHGALLRAGLGGGKDQPEAKAQEHYHGMLIALVCLGAVLLLLFQGPGHPPRPGGQCRCSTATSCAVGRLPTVLVRPGMRTATGLPSPCSTAGHSRRCLL